MRAEIEDKPLLKAAELLSDSTNGGLTVIGSYIPRSTRQRENLLASSHIIASELRVEKILDSQTRDKEIREIIEKYGAVSEQVARAMALQARARARVDYAIGVTGIAGPGGGSSEKPVGTVYLSLAGPEDQLRDCRLNLPGERGRVKYQASQAALDMLRRALLE